MALYGKDVWLIGPEEKAKHDKLFQSLKPVNGKLSGEQSKRYFMKSNLPTPVLGQIWSLADLDKDGRMTAQEFMIGIHLIEAKLKGVEIPKLLPPSLKRSTDPSYHGFSESNTQMPLQPIQTSFFMNGGPAQHSSPNTMYAMNTNMGMQPPNIGMQPLSMGIQPPNIGMQTPLNPNMGMQNTRMNYSSVFTSQTTTVNRVSTLPKNFGFPGQHGAQKQTPPLSRNASFQSDNTSLLKATNPPTYNYSQTLPINQSAFDSLALDKLTDITQLNKPAPAATLFGDIPGPTRLKYTQLFKAADSDKSGLLTGEQARNILLQTGVNPQMLLQIWELSDINRDGNLEVEEFIIAMHLIDVVKSGLSLPPTLPTAMIPAHLRSLAVDGASAGGVAATATATAAGSHASLSRSGSFAEVVPVASFEDRRRMNWDKGQQELERRRRELLERQRAEKEAHEQKEWEIEEHKRMLREEAEKKRLQELENERLRKEEQEREQERLRKEMIEQRLAAQLEAEKHRQQEWESRRKEELLNQKGHEENIVNELKNRLIKLKGDLASETTNRDSLSTSYEQKKVEGRELHNQIEQLSKSRELRVQEITRLQGVLQQSKLELSNIIDEREKYTLQLNQTDSSTTTEALGAIKATIQQMRIGVTLLRRNLTSIEAETHIVLQESNEINKQQKQLNAILHEHVSESTQLKDEIEQKKREEYEQLRLQEQYRRKQEIQEKKQEHLRKTFESELKKRQEREQEAMQKEKQIQGISLRQRQEAHYSNAIQKPTFTKASDMSFRGDLSLKIQQANLFKKQDAIVQKQEDALENAKIPPARPRTRPQCSPVKLAPNITIPPISTSTKDDIRKFEAAFPDASNFDNTSFVADFSAFESIESTTSTALPTASSALTITESTTSSSSGKSKRPPPRPRPPVKVEFSNSLKLDDTEKSDKVKRIDEERRRGVGTEKSLLEQEKERIEFLKKEELEKELQLAQQEAREKEARDNEEREKEEKIRKDADVKRKVEEMQRKRLEKKQAASPKASPDRPPAGPAEQYKKKSMFKMLFDFEARNPDELTVTEGTLVQVDESSTSAPVGWLSGTCNGLTGLFPANYAQKVQENFSDYVDLDMQAAGNLPVPSQELPSIAQKLPKQPIEVKAEEIPKLKPVPRNNSRKAAPLTVPKVAMLPPKTPLKLLQPLAETPKIKQQKTDVGKETVQFLSYDLVPTTTEHKDPFTSAANEQSAREQKVEDIYQNSTELQAAVDTSSGESFQALALYPYRAQKEDHLSFDKNDYINVQQQQDQWWFGESNGKSGWFPKSYVKAVATATTISPVLTEVYDSRDSVETGSNSAVSSESAVSQNEECIALFDYAGPEGDLTFTTGDLISVIAKNGDWWEGMLKGTSGTFPANYVKLKEAEVEKKPEVAMVSTAYSAAGDNEISLKAGQLIHVMQKEGDWWQGEVQVRGKNKPLGWFPQSHVKLMSKQTKGSEKKAAVSAAELAVQEDIYSAPVKRKDQLDHVLAMFSYAAQNDDELTFCKGSVINVISKDGDWWKGEVNGHVGVFPYNYVQVLRSDTPQQTSQWSGAFDSSVLKSMSPTERKRQNHIYELINTEQDYMTDLSLTLEVFYNPLAEYEILTQHELNTVFINWKELIMCNMKFLKAMLVRKKMSTTDKIEGIGDVLIEQSPRFSPYIRFCGCMLKACQLLQAKVEKDAEFKQFEKKCAGDKRLKQNLPLSSYLLKPLQRVTKYPLLITGILNYTPEDHFDRENLIIALERAEDLCSQINEAVRCQESTNRLEWLQERVNLDGLDEKLIFNSQTNCLGQRKYLYHGTLYKHKSNKELKSFMFNDFLLLCRVQSGNLSKSSTGMFHPDDDTKFTIYKKPIFLNEVIVKCPSDPEVNDTLFHVTHIDRVYSFRADSKTLRNGWVSKIQAASQLFIETEREKRSKASRARSLGDSELGRLVVTIIEGADLQASDPTGFSDPYCEVSMGSQEHRTKVIQKDLNPKWNSTMVFHIKDPKKDVLCISVFDRDFFSPNDFLGRTEVSVSQIIEKAKGPITKRLLLHEVATGEIVVTLEIQNMSV